MAKWSCEKCYYDNEATAETCEMCAAPRPATAGGGSGRRMSAGRPEPLEVEAGASASPPPRAARPRPSAAAGPKMGNVGEFLGDVFESEESKMCAMACCGLILFISCFLLGFSFRVIDYDEYGLLRAELSGAIVDKQVYHTGRHFVGLGFIFVKLKKNMRTVTFVEGEESGKTPISVRTIDGKVIVIEASFQYILMEDRIYDIYTEYGTKLEDFFVTVTRSRLRDVAARHSSTEFFADRRLIEASMFAELHEHMLPRMANVIEFQLGRVGLPFSLEHFLADTQLKRIKLAEEVENLVVKEIRANTSVALTRAIADKESELTVIRQQTENNELLFDLERLQITETTAVMVAKVEAESAKNVSIYNQGTENQRLVLVTNTTRVAGETTLSEAEIVAETEQKRADRDVSVARIQAEADANALAAASRARVGAIVARASTLRTAYEALSAQLAFNGTHFNALMWKDAVATHGSNGKLRMDQQQPSDLFLDGQRASLLDNLDDTN